MSKENFKVFVRKHPELATKLLKGTTSWQQLYEIYELYGENNSIWNNYFTKETSITSGANTIKDFINNIQKTIGLLQDIGLTNKESEPIYKRFED